MTTGLNAIQNICRFNIKYVYKKAYNKLLRTLNVMDPEHLTTPISSVNMSVSLSLPYVEVDNI